MPLESTLKRVFKSKTMFVTIALLLLLVCALSDSLAYQLPTPPDKKPDMPDLLNLPGRLLAEGSNTSPVGVLRVARYRLEELSLNVPLQVDIRGRKVEVDKAWRLTIIGGPFTVRALPPVIWIDEVALGVGQESEQLDRISVVTFDRSALREGATISLSYGTSFEDRTELPEKLSLGGVR
jgi:hypothetical protein